MVFMEWVGKLLLMAMLLSKAGTQGQGHFQHDRMIFHV
jgi:hypothetical protein